MEEQIMTLKYGDKREDGFIYLGKNSKGNNHFISPETYEKRKLQRKIYEKNYSKEYHEKNKAVINAKTKIWRMKNKDALKKHRETWYSSPLNRLKHSVNSARQRAIKKNIVFNIEINDLLPIPKYCPILGIELNFKGVKGFIDDSPSIDRIEPSKGYIKGNVKVISWRANRIKSDASVQELKLVIDYIERERNEII
jgi:hypothetical protein